jgi:predicted nicotinamide N-methyase
MERTPRTRRPPPHAYHAFGLTLLPPSHPEVRRVQHDLPRPALHGHKVWPTSFVLLDYLHHRGVPPGARVLDLGCGWGLAGIACTTTFQAQVTGVDADATVFPYLHLHAQRNGVQIATWHRTFADLTLQDLAGFELIVGAEICFGADLVDPVYQVVRSSVAAGVAAILVADPGRPPFDDLCARCVPQGDAAVLTWTTSTPSAETGRILRVIRDAARRAPRPWGA